MSQKILYSTNLIKQILREESRLLTEIKTCWINGKNRAGTETCIACGPEGTTNDEDGRDRGNCSKEIKKHGCMTYTECRDGKSYRDIREGTPHIRNVEAYRTLCKKGEHGLPCCCREENKKGEVLNYWGTCCGRRNLA